MYRALYRKWRPVTFDDVIGQENIVNALQNQILNNKTGHAYIFTGTRGTGKTTCAKIFAKAVNCKNINGANPCKECEVCKGTQSGDILDIVEIDAASNNGVDNIRDLTDSAIYTPGVGKYKVYIIDEVHMLSVAAFNALLKIMEEPPPHIIFILATTEIHKVPPTILSRCQRYDFMRIQVEEIRKRLLYVANEEKITLSEQAASLIARLADGAMRDALSILDTCIGKDEKVDVQTVREMAGITDKSYLFELSDFIASKNEIGAIELTAKLHEKSIDVKRLCGELIIHYRNLLIARATGNLDLQAGISDDDIETYKEKSKEITRKQAVNNIKILSATTDKMSKSLNVGIEFEIAIIEMCEDLNNECEHIKTKETVRPIEKTVINNNVKNKSETNVDERANVYDNTDLNSQAQQKYVEPKIEENVVEQVVNKHEMPVLEPTLKEKPIHIEEPAIKVNKATEQISDDINDFKTFEQWDEVINKMKSIDKLLYANMKGSHAYFDGKRVLIQGSNLFLDYMRQNKFSNALIKKTIAEITGEQYPIGPYNKKQHEIAQDNTLEENIKKLEQYGVNVVYNDE